MHLPVPVGHSASGTPRSKTRERGWFGAAGGEVPETCSSCACATWPPGQGGTCSRTNVLPAGPYRIDVSVFASADDASGGIGARVATATFALPDVENVAVPLEQNP